MFLILHLQDNQPKLVLKLVDVAHQHPSVGVTVPPIREMIPTRDRADVSN